MDLLDARSIQTIPEHRNAYRAWLQTSMTQTVLGILRKEAIPQFPSLDYLAQPNVTAVLHGQQCGANWAIQRMSNLDVDMEGETETLSPDYGARKLLVDQGLLKNEGEYKDAEI